MKDLRIAASFIIVFFMTACNSGDGGPDDKKSIADSLYNEVDKGHIVGMSKMVNLSRMQTETNRLLDSIAKLPAKARDAAAPYKAKLDSLLKELNYAETAMDKWMVEFKYDSAKDDLEQRIKYLTDEKMRVGKVKEAILSSLARADSLLGTKNKND